MKASNRKKTCRECGGVYYRRFRQNAGTETQVVGISFRPEVQEEPQDKTCSEGTEIESEPMTAD